ncbi:Hypothetical protein NTJ_09790 [Nesidiocoris tenuis]|uniref:Uncharacterized protein n=1 Tax=Nesidiocoris tenuis TaxID=355587 RepID=A0ABN7B000_9HEMI|nr:Hypothetical protein NTJ_09790 [Nesidiocoris tenuis]
MVPRGANGSRRSGRSPISTPKVLYGKHDGSLFEPEDILSRPRPKFQVGFIPYTAGRAMGSILEPDGRKTGDQGQITMAGLNSAPVFSINGFHGRDIGKKVPVTLMKLSPGIKKNLGLRGKNSETD